MTGARGLCSAGLSLVAAASIACGGGGGGAPGGPSGPPAGQNAIVIADPGGALSSQETTIRDLVQTTLDRVNGVWPLTGVTITIDPDATRAIAGYGIGGFAPDGATVDISIDTSFPDWEGLLAARLPAIVAHELHHVRRWRGPGYGGTLLQAMVSEGLADHFAVELLGAPVPPWSDAFPRDQTAPLLELARPQFDSTSYDHAYWFFGPNPPLPRWTGYTLGFRIVEDYLAAHPGATAGGLVDTPADAFRP